MRRQSVVIPAFLCMLFVLGADGDSSRPADRQQKKSMKRKVTMEIDYLLYLPKEYGDGEKAWPLMLFLHGAGERGDNLDVVKKHGPPKLIEAGKDLPFIVVAPQCPQGKWWTNQVEVLNALIEETVEKYNVDKSRIYLTGLSMGGFGTWALASTYPERFAAIAPICGGGQPYLASRLRNTPAWVFHGGKDPVVPIAESERMVKALKAVGGDVQFTIYPEAGHDSWTETYENPKLYDWMLSHTTNNR